MSQYGNYGCTLLWATVFITIQLSLIIAPTDCLTLPKSTSAPLTKAQETQLKKMAAPAFAQAGKKEGLEIWRVENFNAVPVKKEDYGKFYSGDCYLVLKTKDSRGKKNWDIHYWIGKDSSQDESGSIAFFATELDDSLGGSPVQHRETENHESQQFLGYFPTGIRYLNGGVKSGFNHVNPNDHSHNKRLYQVKGKKNIRVQMIEPKASAMNKGDSYILDTGDLLYVYYGANSQRQERLRANGAAHQIRDQDHAGRGKVEIIDENASPEEVSKFFSALGGGSRQSLSNAQTGGDDEQFEKNYDAQVELYKVTDASGTLKVEKIGHSPLSKTLLDTNDAFILDTKAGIYHWVGRKSTKSEKGEAMKKADEFLASKKYPSWTPVTRVVEGGEPSTFKEYFTEWRNAGANAGIGRG